MALDYIYQHQLDFESPLTRLQAWGQQMRCAALVSDGGPKGRFSYLCANPIAILTTDHETADNAFAQLADFVSNYAAKPKSAKTQFMGAVIGLCAFELGLKVEHIACGDFRLRGQQAWPDIMALAFDRVLVFDHLQERLTAFGRGKSQECAKTACEAVMSHYLSLPLNVAPLSGPLSELPMSPEGTDSGHAQKVVTVIDRIHKGELFQANIAQSWSGKLKGAAAPMDLFLRLCQDGAAPFSAYFRLDDRAIVSNSPERFIDYSSEGTLFTQPIKGTRPRSQDAAKDKAFADALLASEKDRAENLMIVDLMRHDLSKVSDVGSVKVLGLHQLESFTHVHHLVSTVTAQGKAGIGIVDILRATFPAGSITGAPKVQAMKVISELDAPRGPYCGSLFCLDVSGAFQSNVLIRTLMLQQIENRWHYRTFAGGGIVADSDPEAETLETHTKILTIKKALET